MKMKMQTFIRFWRLLRLSHGELRAIFWPMQDERWQTMASSIERMELNDQIGQAETQFEQGYDDRWRDVPLPG